MWPAKRQSSREPKESFRTNQSIKSSTVRLIDDTGEMAGVKSLADALQIARAAGLDLVEISPQSSPPVCKIIDYGRFLYQREKKKKEAKKHQHTVQLKEIKMRPKTDVHDYNFKVRHVRSFLKHGDKVKLTIRFKGREMAFVDLGNKQIDRVIEDTKDLGKVESKPKMEGRTLFMVLSPLKKPDKKSGDAGEKDEVAKNDEKFAMSNKPAQLAPSDKIGDKMKVGDQLKEKEIKEKEPSAEKDELAKSSKPTEVAKPTKAAKTAKDAKKNKGAPSSKIGDKMKVADKLKKETKEKGKEPSSEKEELKT